MNVLKYKAIISIFTLITLDAASNHVAYGVSNTMVKPGRTWWYILEQHGRSEENWPERWSEECAIGLVLG